MSNTSTPEIATPEIAERERLDTRPIRVPFFHVVLHDDDDHSYEYVIEMLSGLFGHPKSRAFDMAQTVDDAGRVVVDTTVRERAELKRDQIRSYGADPRIPHSTGSMAATIEEAGDRD